MSSFKAERFSSLLLSAEQLSTGLPQYISQINAHHVEFSFGVMQQLGRAIRHAVDPIRKINALLAVLRCLQTGAYPALLFAQVYIVPALAKVTDYLLQNKEVHAVTAFLERSGHAADLPHIQNLSYNYVGLACRVLEIGTIIKPFRIFNGQEFEEPSLFARCYQKLTKEKVSVALSEPSPRGQAQEWRRLYLASLGRWADYSDSLTYFFMEMQESYLGNEFADKCGPLFDMLQYGEPSITEESIARLIDIIAYHSNFDIRIKALKLFDRMIAWGDVEALLVANFTENIETIIKIVFQVQGERAIEEGRHIYPEIGGQELKKLEFYRTFLISLQSWAIAFPTHEFLLLSPANAKDPSPINHFYRLLREKKKAIFPPNPNLIKFQTQARMAMMEKTFRNRLILRDINNQSQLSANSSVSIMVQHKLKDLQEYYDTHKEIVLNLIAKKVNPYESMEKLAEFQLHFEDMVECLSLDEDPGPVLDKLIESGLELIEIVTLMHAPFLQLLHGQLTEKQFLERAMTLCVNYFSPPDQQHFVSFYSQKVAQRKSTLVEMLRLQKSDPLEKDLRFISNSIMVKQFRQKYRQKLDKLSSSKQSEQSEINLEIFTKTKFTRESREEMDRSFKNEKKDKEHNDLSNAQLLQVKNNLIPNGGNSLKGSREKKKLTLASRELENKKKNCAQAQIQNENRATQDTMKKSKMEMTSQTRSSRQKSSQKSIKSVDCLVSSQEYPQYFSFIPNDSYKYSYICHNLLIFKSPFLIIQRFVLPHSSDPQKLKIQFILTPYKTLPEFAFFIEDQQCIKMQYSKANSAVTLIANKRFHIEIEGQMKKIPLRLPTIAMFLQKRLFFQYILPFTLNFFMQPAPASPIEEYNRQRIQAKYRYFTPSLILSKVIFPQQTLANIFHFFPGSIRIFQSSEELQKYVWLASYSKLCFLFVFQLDINNKTFLIRGYDARCSDDHNESLLKYAVNYLAHLLSEREA